MTRSLQDILGIARTPGPPPTVLAPWISGDGDWLDLRGHDIPKLLRDREERPDALHGVSFSRVAFGDKDGEKEPAHLDHASLAECAFDNVVFVNTKLLGVYFRKSSFVVCDFRYAHLNGTSFQEATLDDCDFYRAFFDAANVFTQATFRRVSFDKAWVAGITGLRRRNFSPRAQGGDKLPMAQECSEHSYAEFLDLTKGNRPESHPLEEAVEQARLDVADVYRSLSGMWTAQGQLRYAGFAYEKCKNLERAYYSPIRRWRTNRRRDQQAHGSPQVPHIAIKGADVARWLTLVLGWALANFGESMRRVVGWLALVILIPGFVFWLTGDVKTAGPPPETVHSLWKCILFSFEQMTDSVKNFQSTGWAVDMVGSIQFVIGVALLGLFGFTLGNWLRNT